jgi:hypothetical protein
MVVARRYEVFIQVSITVSADKSFPIKGNATFTEEPRNAVKKEPVIEITRTIFLTSPLPKSTSVYLQIIYLSASLPFHIDLETGQMGHFLYLKPLTL